MRTGTRSSMVVGAIVAGSLLAGCWLPEPEPQPEPVGIIVTPNTVSWTVEAGANGPGTQQITISTDVAASAFDLSISGTGFSIESTNCPTGGTLLASTSCSTILGFISAAPATQTGQLNVIADDPDGDDISVSVNLSGVALP